MCSIGKPVAEQDLLYLRNQSCDDQPTEDEEEQTPQVDAPIPNTDMKSIQVTLNESILKLKQEISLVVDKKLVSRGVWDEQLKLVKIVERRNQKQYVAHFTNNGYHLYPFEALFAVECRALIVSYQNIPLSIEESYKLLLKDKFDYKLYRVFSILSKSGYHVKHCKNEHIAPPQAQDIDINRNKNHLYESTESTLKKKPKLNTASGEVMKCDNYKVVTSIRPLALEHLRKLSIIDKKLLSCCEPDNESKSILFNLRDSVLPVEMNKRLLPLHGHSLKPLINFSAIHHMESLFNIIERAGPKSNHSLVTQQLGEPTQHSNISVDFEVFRSKSNVANSVPLFRVITVNEADSLPSISTISRLEANVSSPLFFALISDSLEYNFYAFERVTIEDEYPRLWEKYYA